VLIFDSTQNFRSQSLFFIFLHVVLSKWYDHYTRWIAEDLRYNLSIITYSNNVVYIYKHQKQDYKSMITF